MSTFNFDAKKSESNRMKHDIGFVEAQDLWNDPSVAHAQKR